MGAVLELGKAYLALVVNWAFYRGRWYCLGRTFCPVRHRVGQIVVHHETSFDCSVAVRMGEVAEMMRRVVEDRYFPNHRIRVRINLYLVCDSERGVAFQRGRDVAVNLLRPIAGGDHLLDTLIEELFHLYEDSVGLVGEYVFNFSGGYGTREEIVRYYAENDFEYRALVAAVELIGYRADLLEEVKQYRVEHGLGGA